MKRRVVVRDAMMAFVAMLILASCGGGGGGDTTAPPPPPPPPAGVASVTVTLLVSTINVGQTSLASAVVRDAQNNVLIRTVTWSSSNVGVASVSGSGTVTGVSPGTASITASVEGKTGSASITVAAPQAPPQISSLTFTQNGQPANLSQVAGKLTLNFNLDVPTGYSGTVIVKLDTIEVSRQTVSAPFFYSGADGLLPAPDIKPMQVEIETSLTTITTSNNEIRELVNWRNGVHTGLLQVVPAAPGGQTVQQQFTVTTNNPIHAHGFWGFNGTTAVGADGKTYTGGVGVGQVVFATYGNEAITNVQLALTESAPQYRNPAGGSLPVYQTIALADLKPFSLPSVPVERANLTYIISAVTIDGSVVKPQVGYIGNSQYTTDLIGSGFANTQQQVQGLTPQAGVGLQLVVQPTADLATGTVHGRMSIEAENLDNLAPRQISLQNEPVLSLYGRMTTVGGPAFGPLGGFGANNGQLSMRYDFADGFRSDRLVDATGIDNAKTEFYAGPISDQANLFKTQYKIGTTFSLAESNGSRVYTAGARAFDKRGNFSDWTLRTSPENAWNVQGSLSIGSNIGLDVAEFGYTEKRADLNLTAPPVKLVWNQSTFDAALAWTLAITNSVVGIPNGYLSARAKLNGLYVLGAGLTLSQFLVLNVLGGVNSATTTLFLSALLNLAIISGSNQGLYEFDFKAADNAGRYIGGLSYPLIYWLLLDYIAPQAPLITLSGNVTPGSPSAATLSGTDNYGIQKAFYGTRFTAPSGLFVGGQAYVLEDVPVQGTFDGTTIKSLSTSITDVTPIVLWFFDPFNGIVDTGNPYRSNGRVLQLRDFAWNLSPVAFASFNNTAPMPTLTNVAQAKATVGPTNLCAGTSCAAGGQATVNLNFNYFDDRPTGDPMISKVDWFAIPSAGGGFIYKLGTAQTYTSAIDGSGRRITFMLPADMGGYCGPPGSAQVFPVAWNVDRKYILKAGSFFGVNINAPNRFSNMCNAPPP